MTYTTTRPPTTRRNHTADCFNPPAPTSLRQHGYPATYAFMWRVTNCVSVLPCPGFSPSLPCIIHASADVSTWTFSNPFEVNSLLVINSLAGVRGLWLSLLEEVTCPRQFQRTTQESRGPLHLIIRREGTAAGELQVSRVFVQRGELWGSRARFTLRSHTHTASHTHTR